MTRWPAIVLAATLAPAVFLRTASGYPGEAYVLSSRALEAYRAGKFDEATKLFEEAIEKKDSAVLKMGLGAARYRAGEHDEAAEMFEQVFDSQRPDLTAAARYNAGVVKHRTAQETLNALRSMPAQAAASAPGAGAPQMAADPAQREEAIKNLEAAVKSYREAIKRAPGDIDMIYNYELALRQLEELKNQPPPPPQPQQDQKPDENQNKPEDPPDQQEQQPEPDKSGDNKNDQNQQQKPPEQNQPQQQPEQEQQPDQGKPDEQKKDESPRGDEQPPSQQQRPQPREGGQPPVKPGEMTPEDVQRLLNSLPDGDQKALQRMFNARHQIRGDMEKDW